MAVSHKGAISFGLVHIPVSLYTATQDSDIRFNQLHKDHHSRIRYKKVCGHCGEEVTSKDIVKGFEYDKDKYVIITEEDFEKIKTEKDRTIQILHFVSLDEISPIYFDKTYHAIPNPGGERAFELLRKAMMEEGKIAIGKTVMGNSETLLAIIPREEGILIEKMFFQEDIKEIPKDYPKVEVDEKELEMAKVLINSMDKPFKPEEYKDEYQMRLKELIEKKIAGKEIVTAVDQEEADTPDNVIDLMEALKKSIEQNKDKEEVKARATTKPKVKKAKGRTRGA
ncbi:MAG: Ku protein [Tissierellia bacterium]|nr:Ku protein [Tissierellia bacterium]